MEKKMTIEEIWAKHQEMFEECDQNKVRFCNDEDNDGFWFSTDGYQIYFVGGRRVLSVGTIKYMPKMAEAAKEAIRYGVLTTNQIKGIAGKDEVRLLQVNRIDRNTEAFVNEKFLRGLPKNTNLYVSSCATPVLATLDCDGLPIIKMIMPMRAWKDFIPLSEFSPDGKEATT